MCIFISAILAIISALLTFFAAKKKTNASDTQAAIAAAAVGAGTYYVATETEWGQETVGAIEGWLGVQTTTDESGSPVIVSGESTTSGRTVTGPDGQPVVIPVPEEGTSSTSAWDVLKSWGPVGTATVVGTTGVVSSGYSKYLPWAAAAAVLFLIIK